MKHRFKAVEMGIFAVVSLIFLNSVYSLFTDGALIGDNERRPLAASKPKTETVASDKQSEPRAPASDSISGFVPYETKCQTSGELLETSAAKVRILGPFCGAADRQIAGDSSAKGDSSLQEYKIENVTGHYTATVFSDHSTGKFSTDFIPLEHGTNKIAMEFKYKSGKIYPVELTIVRK